MQLAVTHNTEGPIQELLKHESLVLWRRTRVAVVTTDWQAINNTCICTCTQNEVLSFLFYLLFFMLFLFQKKKKNLFSITWSPTLNWLHQLDWSVGACVDFCLPAYIICYMYKSLRLFIDQSFSIYFVLCLHTKLTNLIIDSLFAEVLDLQETIVMVAIESLT